MILFFGIMVIFFAAIAIFRGVDLRFVLMAAAWILAFIAGTGDLVHLFTGGITPTTSEAVLAFFAPSLRIMRTFLIMLSNEEFLVPICLAMAFAYVLRATSCDEHLIQLLVKPLRRTGTLFLPGMVLVGFVVNIPLISQGATAAAVGTVLVPLGRALKLSPCVLGAALALGSSIGGELLNPASPEIHSVIETLRPSHPDIKATDSVAQIRPLIGWHLLVSTVVFWILNRKSVASSTNNASEEPFRVNPVKAVVPFVPLVLLLLLAPPFQVWHVPPSWLLVDPTNVTEAKAFDSRLIGAAMLVGVLVAAMTMPSAFNVSGKAFFEGAGFAFTFIIAMIVAANCFGEGVKMIGFDTVIGHSINSLHGLLLPLAAGVPLLFGVMSGSGMAATQSLFKLFVAPSNMVGVDPLRTGALVSIGAAAGRTMSPVSPVILVSSKLTEQSPFALFRRVAIPLLVGMIVTVLISKLR